MELILVRHGETVENREGIIQGHLPGRLSEKGVQQAMEVGLALKDRKIDCIYCSDLARAVNTAREIARFHEGVPFFKVKELREIDKGEFTGVKKSEVGDKKPQKSESLEALQARAQRFLDRLLEERGDQTVVVVAHKNINLALMSVIFGVPAKEIRSLDYPPNASLSVFNLSKEGLHEVKLLNSTAHLTSQD